MTTKQLTFFDLPPEIRNTVYEFVGAPGDQHVYLNESPASNKVFKYNSSFIIVSKQVRKEYALVFEHHARNTACYIITNVKHFGYEHISSSLQSVPASRVQTLTRESPTLVMGLNFTNTRLISDSELKDWVSFCANRSFPPSTYYVSEDIGSNDLQDPGILFRVDHLFCRTNGQGSGTITALRCKLKLELCKAKL